MKQFKIFKIMTGILLVLAGLFGIIAYISLPYFFDLNSVTDSIIDKNQIDLGFKNKALLLYLIRYSSMFILGIFLIKIKPKFFQNLVINRRKLRIDLLLILLPIFIIFVVNLFEGIMDHGSLINSLSVICCLNIYALLIVFTMLNKKWAFWVLGIINIILFFLFLVYIFSSLTLVYNGILGLIHFVSMGIYSFFCGIYIISTKDLYRRIKEVGVDS